MNEPTTIRQITGTEHDGNFLFLQHDGYDLMVLRPCERDGEGGVADLTDEEHDAWANRVVDCLQALDGIENPAAIQDVIKALRAVAAAGDAYWTEEFLAAQELVRTSLAALGGAK